MMNRPKDSTGEPIYGMREYLLRDKETDCYEAGFGRLSEDGEEAIVYSGHQILRNPSLLNLHDAVRQPELET